MCRVSSSSFARLDGNHAPFVRFVFETSGLMMVEERRKWLKGVLVVVIGSGGIFTVSATHCTEL